MWLGCPIPELCCWFSHSSGFMWNSVFPVPAGTACVGLFWFSNNCCIFLLHSRKTGWIPTASGVAAHQELDHNKVLCSHHCARGIWEEKQIHMLWAPTLGRKKVVTAHPNTLKVRALTPHPLSCALLVRYQHLPVPFNKEIPFMYAYSSFFMFFFFTTRKKTRR